MLNVTSETRRAALVAIALGLFLLPSAARAVTAEAILADMPFSDDERKRILAGELVQAAEKETSDRELSIVMAFLIKTPPADLAARFKKAADYGLDKSVTSFGEIHGDGSPGDFQKLVLIPNGDAEAKRYLAATGGDDLNLSSAEISSFSALAAKTKSGVEEQIRKNLLARFQAYRARGLSGLAAYDRGGGKTRDPGEELRKSTEASKAVAKNAPDFYAALLNYPGAKPAGIDEKFFWVNFKVDDRPTISLTHRMEMPFGNGGFALADRHYYVSRSHNALQVVAGILPADQGSIVFYGNRTSTDQAAGFGASAKHSIGRKIMGGQIAAFFEQVRAEAKKK